jgi:outer membrane protein assembly factor BamB
MQTLGRILALLAVASAAVAAQDPPAEEILRSAPAPRGMCVVVGVDASLLAELAGKSALFIHALDRSEEKVREARRLLEPRGFYGRVAVEPWRSAALPYADHLANLVIAPAADVPDAELLRVAAPGGAVWTRRGGAWTMRRRERPEGFDEWTHARHGPGGNVVSRDRALAPPRGLRWVAGAPSYGTPEYKYSVSAMLAADGRNFYIHTGMIAARDSFNGTLLWTRPVGLVTFQERDPETKKVLRSHRVYPVASGGALFALSQGKLLALEGTTGKTRFEAPALPDPRELVAEGRLLLLAGRDAVRAYAVEDGRTVWEAPVSARRLVAGDGRVLGLAGGDLVGLDLASGKELWRAADPDVRPAQTLSYHGGFVALEKSSFKDEADGCGLAVFSARDGKRLWKRDYAPAMSHLKTARACFAGGLLWIHAWEGKQRKVLGLDPATGDERRRWDGGTGGGRCAPGLATERFFVAPDCDFTDLETGRYESAPVIRHTCQFPFVPAYGLLHAMPNHCICVAALRGYLAVAPAAAPADEGAGALLMRGSAVSRPEAARPESEWPTYRHDASRSGATPGRIGRAEVEPRWEIEVAAPAQGAAAEEWGANPFVVGPVTSPVAAAGLVVVAAPDRHRVDAFDAATGRARWSFTAGGRVDGPPTYHEGRFLFGSHDGWVYALNADDGSLAWRFRAAPGDARIVAHGQMESPWPVPGSVLADRGVAYFAAGRHPLADGGVHVVAVKARTGERIWKRAITEIAPKWKANWEGLSVVDIPVLDGGRVAVSRWRFDPATGDVEFVPRAADYQAEGKPVPRGLWGYGLRQVRHLKDRPAGAFDERGVHKGGPDDVALLSAGGVPVAATADGVLRVGERTLRLPAPPVRDGLIVAYGRLYVATRKGTLVCLE